MFKLFDFKCNDGRITEHLVYAEDSTVECPRCYQIAVKVFTPARGRALYFEEGRTREIPNLEVLDENNNSTGRVFISSNKQHKEAMKRAGVTEAGAPRGTGKGRWI